MIACVNGQLFQGMKLISHFLPAGEQFIENFSIGAGGAVQQNDSAGMDAAQQLLEGFFVAGLFVFIPVYISQAPEEGVIAQFFGHL